MSGSTSYHAGLSAEETVARSYTARGYKVAKERFRGKAGEIDLVLEKDGALVFVEVKKSKTHAGAAERVKRRQMDRIFASASEYLASQPSGQNTPCRFDVGLVDSLGRVEILENAFCG